MRCDFYRSEKAGVPENGKIRHTCFIMSQCIKSLSQIPLLAYATDSVTKLEQMTAKSATAYYYVSSRICGNT